MPAYCFSYHASVRDLAPTHSKAQRPHLPLQSTSKFYSKVRHISVIRLATFTSRAKSAFRISPFVFERTLHKPTYFPPKPRPRRNLLSHLCLQLNDMVFDWKINLTLPRYSKQTLSHSRVTLPE